MFNLRLVNAYTSAFIKRLVLQDHLLAFLIDIKLEAQSSFLTKSEAGLQRTDVVLYKRRHVHIY